MRSELLEPRYLLHGAAAPLPFTDGLVLRLVGDDVTASGTDVVAWADSSGNGNSVAPLGGSAPQVSHGVLNNHDVVQLDGIDDALGGSITSLPSGNADRTVYILADYDSSGWGGFLYGASGSNESFGVASSDAGFLGVYGSGSGNNFESDVLSTPGSWITQAAVLEGGELRTYSSGNLIDQQTHTFNTGTSLLRVGQDLDDSTFVDMDVAEILVFDRAISDAERAQLDNYFNTTYALTPQLFRRELVSSDFNNPMNVKFLPDGRALVPQKDGVIKLVDFATTPATVSTYLTITNVDDSTGENGLQDIEVDPNFPTEPYIYAFYSAIDTGRFKLERFTHDTVGDVTADPASNVLIYDKPDAWNDTRHHGGTLAFGPDGLIYMTTGDTDVPQNSRREDHSDGKILRIYKDGTIPPLGDPNQNPYADGPGGNLDEIWVKGLRNPFRGSFDLPTGRFIVGDVGSNDQQTAIEEINISVKNPLAVPPLDGGEDFGWQICQGSSFSAGGGNGCNITDAPAFEYPHNGVNAAVIGGAVYRDDEFPSHLNEAYFYGDFTRGWIRYLTFDPSDPTIVTGDFPFLDNINGVVGMRPGPDGAFYYSELFTDSIFRIVNDPNTQLPVITSAQADVLTGPAPLEVTFTSTATGPGTLSYRWDFGDGTEAFVANPPAHTYAPGSYTAQLFVTNESGTVASNPIEITSGTPPTVEITSPSDGSLFRGGDVITFAGFACEGPMAAGGGCETGEQLPPQNLTWDVVFLHDDHFHPQITGFTDTDNGTFTIPTSGHSFTDQTGFRITLTAIDSEGLTTSSSVEVFPKKVDITFDTNPAGLILTLDALPLLTPDVYDTMIDFTHEISAADGQCLNGTLYDFDSWSNGGAQTHTITVPDTNTAITANFTAVGSCSNNPPLAVDDSYNLAPGVPITAYSNDFDGNEVFEDGVSGGFIQSGVIESVQGYDQFGFSGSFIRNRKAGNPASETTLTLSNLPPHESIDLNFLLAIIDSWDGEDTASTLDPDFFNVSIDGTLIFSEAMSNSPAGSQSYTPPVGVELVRMQQLGFRDVGNGDDTESGYNLGLDGLFDNIPHTASTLSIDFFASGEGWFGGQDESFAIEDVEVVLNPVVSLDTTAAGRPTVLENDVDADGDPLTASLVADPSNGTVVLNSDGSFVYTHDGSATLTDTFTYVANDATSSSNVSTVTINLVENTAPLAVDDSYSVGNGATLDTSALGLPTVLDNDTDPDSDPIIAAFLVAGPSNGTIDFNSDGSFTYTHDGSSTTTDSFTYNATDGNNVSNDATVTLSIDPTRFYVADATRDDTFEYDSAGAFVERYDLDSSNLAPVGSAAFGTTVLVLNINGVVFSYDSAGNLQGSWQATGLISPEGIATDGQDVWIVDRVTDSIHHFANAANRVTGSVGADATIALDSSNSSAFGITTDGTNFWVLDAASDSVFKYGMDGTLEGSWSIDSSNANPRGITVNPSNADDVWIVDRGTDRVYQYDGGASLTSGTHQAIASFALSSGSPSNVNPQGIAISGTAGIMSNEDVVAQDDDVTTDEATTLLGDVLLDNGNGPDSGEDPLSVNEVNGSSANVGTQITLASGALLTVNSDGTFTYDPNGQFDSLESGQTATDSFTYTIGDAVGGTDSATVVVTIDGIGSTTAPGNFYVPDATRDDVYEYEPAGALSMRYDLTSGNNASVGAAAFNDLVWVLDRNDTVYVYNTLGVLQGSWNATGLLDPEGIATDGQHIWIVDRGADSVLYFQDAAGALSGSLSATSTFDLDSSNSSPFGVTTDGTYLWVINAAATDEVYKYLIDGTLAGSWAIDPANKSPRGITIDPNNVNHLWIVDRDTDRVYQYDGAAAHSTGSFAATSSFALTTTNPPNVNPQGLAMNGSGAVSNQPPIAVDDDLVSTNEDSSIVAFNVLDGSQSSGAAADSDADGSLVPSSVTVVTDVTDGTLINNADGTFDYTPDPDFFGVDSFTYTVDDDSGATSNPATVTITVTGVQDSPVAVDDYLQANEDDVLSGSLLAANPQSWIWTVPVISEDQINNSAADPPGDGSTDSTATGSATIEIKPNPDFIAGRTTNTDEEYLISVSISWSGLLGDLTTIHIHGWLTPSGQPTAPDNSTPTHLYEIPGLESTQAVIDSGVDRRTDTYVVTDQFLPHTHPFDDVNARIEPQQIIDEFKAGRAYFNVHTELHPMGEIRGNLPAVPDVLDNDPDNETLMVTEVDGNSAGVGTAITLASGAQLTVNADGTFDYDPDGNFESLGAGDEVTDTFTYTIDDGSGGSDLATVEVRVHGVNDAPTLDPIGNLSVVEGDTLVVPISSSDVESDGLTFDDANTLPGFAVLSDNGDGTATLTVSPGSGDAASYSGIQIRVTDDGNPAAADFELLTIEVTAAANTPPVAQDDDVSTDEQTPLSGDVFLDNGNGADTDLDSDPLTVTEVEGVAANVGTEITLLSGALLTLDFDGFFLYNPNGRFDLLSVGQSLTDSFTYKIDDGNGGMDTATVTVTIDGVDSNETKFYVVDATVDDTIEYDSTGGVVDAYPLTLGNQAPRGATSSALGGTIWVVDNDASIYVYDDNGGFSGSWSATGLSRPEGIASDGQDIWIVDRGTDQVYMFEGAASLISGSVSATSSFALAATNTSPFGITTDGVNLWVVNDSATDEVFKYSLDGTLLGSWQLDSANASPRGITIDPNNVDHLWVVDHGTDTVYQYDSASTHTSGAFAADSSFALVSTNANPQGIADPPVFQPNSLDLTSGQHQLTVSVDAVESRSPSRGPLRIIHDQNDTIFYDQRWTLLPPRFQDGTSVHRLGLGSSDETLVEIVNSRPQQNPRDRYDANADGRLTASDALRIINVMEEQSLAGEESAPNLGYVDVTGDNVVSALDALNVINEIARRALRAESEQAFSASAVDDALLALQGDDEDDEAQLLGQLF